MAEIPFHLTKMGRIYYEVTLPQLVESVNVLAEKMGKLSNLLKFETDGSLKVNTTPPAVFVVRYSHKHGVDVWVKRSRERALASAAEVVLHWIDNEIDDPQKKKEIRDAIDGNKIERALQLWGEYTNEYIEIDEATVDRPTEDEVDRGHGR
jgi:hypothetical protein